MSHKITYELEVDDLPEDHVFTDDEKAKLRPICETLAMLDGNAFFAGMPGQQTDHYEHYLPEAWCLYERNGGDKGWAGQAEFARIPLAIKHDPELKELYNQFKFLALLKGVEL